MQALETGIKETRDEAEEMEIRQEQFPSIPETTRHRTRTSWADDQPQAVDGNIDDNNQDEEKTTPMLSTDEADLHTVKKTANGRQPTRRKKGEPEHPEQKKTPANIQ